MKMPQPEILKTGISGLDEILQGGIPRKRLYLLQGEPGTGKTTLAFQFLLEGIRNKERCMYISFSESEEELQSVADSHGWDISKIHKLELGSIEEQLKPEAQNTVFYPSEVEMNQTVKVVYDAVEEMKPDRIVFDSISEMRMLADSSLKYRRQMLAFKQFFAKQNVTVILLDDMTASPEDLQVQSIVHGVFNLIKVHPEFGEERRRINVVKLRGINYIGGFHDYVIRKGGVFVFPRMLSASYNFTDASHTFSSGNKELDALLGGGLIAGTSSLFLGPAGTGKSTLALLYAYSAAERGEKAAIFAFEEGLNTLILRAKSLGLDITKHLKSGMLYIQKVDPAQMSPGEFTYNIKELVAEKNFKVIVVDSLNGYLHAMPQEQFLTLQLHELLAYLNGQGIITIMVLAQQGMLGNMMNTPIDLTYLADTVIITRYFEAKGSVHKAVSVIKQRAGLHESTIRELTLGPTGIKVGKPLSSFQGILTGIPLYIGNEEEELS